ncbi:MAG: (d)CMP kinase, partial [Jatrophihabitans sp.]
RDFRLAGERNEPDLARVAASLRRRDARDSSRPTSPLHRPDGATEVDTSELGIDEVVELLVELATEAVPTEAIPTQAVRAEAVPADRG